MKDIDYSKIVKVVIYHETYKYSNTIICNRFNYIDVINNLAKRGIKIIGIRFYEED